MIEIKYWGMCEGCKNPQLELYGQNRENETRWMLICKNQWDCAERSRKCTPAEEGAR